MDLIIPQNLPNQLKKHQIYFRLNKFNLQYCPKYLQKTLNELYESTIKSLQPIFNYSFTGKETSKPSHSQQINTIVWQFGHLILFYLNSVIRLLSNHNLLKENSEYVIKIIEYLSNDINLPETHIHYYDYYDSFITSSKTRLLLLNKVSIKNLRHAYTLVIELITIYLEDKIKTETPLNPIDSYLIMLGILHNDMHYEAILFTQYFLNYPKPQHFIMPSLNLIKTPKPLEIEFVNITSGIFKQGCNDNDFSSGQFIFDNEKPQFEVEMPSFEVSKYPITEGQYLKFIEDNGYFKKQYWCLESWNWLKKYDINAPQCWDYDEIIDTDNSNLKYEFIIKKKIWFKTIWNNRIKIDPSLNYPVTHISWFEAKAFCKWAKCRLIKESEWEYLATNSNSTKYPWGNEAPTTKFCNIDYSNGGILPVNYYELENKENNNESVSQLIGNVWEWCEEVICPYDGFVIDPVYREMSYPYFGEKRICRGGAWSTSSYLISSTYRNAQPSDCRLQWIGFRVCRD